MERDVRRNAWQREDVGVRRSNSAGGMLLAEHGRMNTAIQASSRLFLGLTAMIASVSFGACTSAARPPEDTAEAGESLSRCGARPWHAGEDYRTGQIVRYQGSSFVAV